ncbi:MAG: HlyC/CorC family transporter [Candidatus Omnitrophica bacterium]|nr:HlyC/CorC family transporter [Candidatus Omnitrophota bacterium]
MSAHLGYLLGISFLLGLSAFFSMSETALFSLSRLQIWRIRRKNPAAGNLIHTLITRSRRTLTAILIGNNLVNVMAASLATTWAVGVFGSEGVWVAIIGFTGALLVVGEVTPKIYAVHRADSIAAALCWPLDLFARLTTPLRACLKWMTNPFLRNFLKHMAAQENWVSQEELRAIVSLSAREGVIDSRRGEMIENVFSFGERPVKEIMTPHTDLVACSMQSTREALVEKMRETRRSHILIYRERMDQMVGFVSTRAFLLGPEPDFRKMIQPLYFVPETRRIGDLLTDFEHKRMELALVVDEYGGTAGLVTREDILEEVVGELYDEFERPDEGIVDLGGGRYRIGGNVPVKDVSEKLGLVLPQHENVETVAGLVLSLYGHIPQEGIQVNAGSVALEVERVIGRRVTSVLLTRGSKGRIP